MKHVKHGTRKYSHNTRPRVAYDESPVCSECKRPFTGRSCFDPYRILCEACEKRYAWEGVAIFIGILIFVFLGAVWLSH